MSFRNTLARAKRGFREELRLYVVSVSSLVVAFMCLGGSLLALENLSALAERWGESGHVTVYLREGVSEAEIVRLSVVLEGLREVKSLEVVSSEQARAQFLAESEIGADLSELPADVFPASIELSLAKGTSLVSIDKMVARIGALEGVSDVESYRGWFERLSSLLSMGRTGATVLGVLVGVCVFAVVGNTIRLSVSRRRREIEVMKLCGATDRFVRGPFVLEGVAQGLFASLLAVLLLALGFYSLRGEIDGALSMVIGMKTTFLGPLPLLALILAGAGIGALSSTLSLRRYLEI